MNKAAARKSVFVRLALANDEMRGMRLSPEDVQELMSFKLIDSIGDRASRDAARAGCAIDDIEGLVKAPPGYAESVLEERP
jgi:hypothetical protein